MSKTETETEVEVGAEEDMGFPLVLSWTSWDNSSHEVTYDLEETAGGLYQLTQSHVTDGGAPVDNIVAKHIESAEVSHRPYTGGVLTLTVTVTVGAGSEQQIETKVYRIVPRPGL